MFGAEISCCGKRDFYFDRRAPCKRKAFFGEKEAKPEGKGKIQG